MSPAGAFMEGERWAEAGLWEAEGDVGLGDWSWTQIGAAFCCTPSSGLTFPFSDSVTSPLLLVGFNASYV